MIKIDLPSFYSDISYNFKNENFVIEALTHKSFSVDENKDKPHNERFEFLGDSIVNFIIADLLLTKNPNDPEGALSKKRASLVNQATLCLLAQNKKLGQHIVFGPGEVKQGSPSNPRILASTLEALIGAIYLDSNFVTCQKWVLEMFSAVDEMVDMKQGQISDYKTRLQELTQKHKLGTPIYELVYTSGPSHKPQFLVSLKLNDIEKTRAVGASKKMAEQSAAEMFFNELTQIYLNSVSTEGDKK